VNSARPRKTTKDQSRDKLPESQPDAFARERCLAEESLRHVSGCDFWTQAKPEVISGLFLTEHRHVEAYVQASCVALPATLSVKSVVKKQNHIFTTDSTENTDESQSSQTEFFGEEGRSMFSHFAPCGTDKLNH
jgi:hypothetical protein